MSNFLFFVILSYIMYLIGYYAGSFMEREDSKDKNMDNTLNCVQIFLEKAIEEKRQVDALKVAIAFNDHEHQTALAEANKKLLTEHYNKYLHYLKTIQGCLK